MSIIDIMVYIFYLVFPITAVTFAILLNDNKNNK